MRVLMIGAGRNLKGGVSTVVNQYYAAGLDTKTDLKYIATMKDGSKAKKIWTFICALMEFKHEVRHCDIVHIHMSINASFYRKSIFVRIAHRYGKKIIIHMHSGAFDTFYNNKCNNRQKKKVRYIFSLADAVIALSEEWKECISKIYNADKIHIIYNAVKIPDYQRTDYSDQNVLFLGRLSEGKGVYDLLSAVSYVIKALPCVHFYLAGDGEVEKCKEMCANLNIQDYVTFLGWINGEEKDRVIRQCSTFVLPSYHEGMPMSLLEAMSYGCVVVSTEVGGIPKVIKNGNNGYLCEPGNVQVLAEKMICALTADNRATIGGKACMTIRDFFNAEHNIDQIVTLYGSLCTRGG